MNIKEQILKKIDELGAGAPKFFGYAQKTLDGWKKKPNSIPLRAVERALSSGTPATTIRQSTASVVPPRNPDPMMPSPSPEQVAPPAAPQPEPPRPYTIENAQTDIVAIVNHFNNTVSPVIQGAKTQGEVNATAIASINEQLRALLEWKAGIDRLVPSQQHHAPTVGELLAAQPSDQFNQLSAPSDLPSRLNPAAKAQVIQEFHPNGNNLDTGIAPSAEDRARSLNALADKQDPRNPGKLAGPATPPPQDAPGIPGWTNPWPQPKR